MSFTVSASQGEIHVAGCNGKLVSVFTADGRAVGVKVAGENADFTVMPGFYLVSSEGHTEKIAVR